MAKLAIEPPVAIALIGAPGTHKQEIAEHYQRVSKSFFAEHGHELDIISNPGEEIERKFNHAMGSSAGFLEDLWAFYYLYQAEYQKRLDSRSFISVGSMLSPLAHCAVNLETLLRGLQTEDTKLRMELQKVALTLMTPLAVGEFRYNFAFYVPHQEGVVLPDTDEILQRYHARVDSGLRTIFGNFGMGMMVLEEGTSEEKAQKIHDVIVDILTNGVERNEPEQEDSSTPDPDASDDAVA